MKENISIFWFRRDLRLHDNIGLTEALEANKKVMLIFIFDVEILEDLPRNDGRLTFIHSTLSSMNEELQAHGASINCLHGKTDEIWAELANQYRIENIYFNKDYEPYAVIRDNAVAEFLSSKNIPTYSFKDQVIFEEHDILKNDGTPYTVFTPYKNKWLTLYNESDSPKELCVLNLMQKDFKLQKLESLGFTESNLKVPEFDLAVVTDYNETRDFPSVKGTSNLSTYLRFGTVSIRQLVSKQELGSTFLSELIWREFFMQIIFNFPDSAHSNFKRKYDFVQWRNNEEEFKRWCSGTTGYPIVDAGMRELNTTGLMHNRVRMITAGFLCKHLLIDWRWGEAYFAEKLMDYDLSANVGNWQWAAGTGCDSAPYFRIFNPAEQQKKFDKEYIYINKWLPDLNTFDYPTPMVEHKYARERALTTYKEGLKQ